MDRPLLRRSILSAVLAFTSAAAFAQQQPMLRTYSAPVDIGLTYTAERSLRTFSGQNFWKQGGSISVGSDIWKGFGPAVDVTLTHAGSIGSSSVGITTTSVTFGPRYRWLSDNKLSPYGQALFGLAHGSGSVFPSATGAKDTANSFAMMVDVGLDYRVSKSFDIRIIEAGWAHSSLPNGADNTQNNFRMGFGVAMRFGH